jgi:hypothetical protein
VREEVDWGGSEKRRERGRREGGRSEGGGREIGL